MEPVDYHSQAPRSKWFRRYVIFVPLLAVFNVIMDRFLGEILHAQTQLNRHSATVVMLRICGMFLAPVIVAALSLLPLSIFMSIPIMFWIISNALVSGASIIGTWHVAAILRSGSRLRD